MNMNIGAFLYSYWSQFNHIHVHSLVVLEYEYIHEQKRPKIDYILTLP